MLSIVKTLFLMTFLASNLFLPAFSAEGNDAKLNTEIKKLEQCKSIYEKVCPRNPKLFRNAMWQRECLKKKIKKLPKYCAQKFKKAYIAQKKKVKVLKKKYKQLRKKKMLKEGDSEFSAELTTRESKDRKPVRKRSKKTKAFTKKNDDFMDDENLSQDNQEGSSWIGKILIVIALLLVVGYFVWRKFKR